MSYSVKDIVNAYNEGFLEGLAKATSQPETGEPTEPSELETYWNTINQNIANYNGTGEGQKDVE